jgi:hypothetical protein
MAAGAPLTNLALGASSVADDLGYVALNDLAVALGDIAADYRVIGGHMVTMLAARWQLGPASTARPEMWILVSRRLWHGNSESPVASGTSATCK